MPFLQQIWSHCHQLFEGHRRKSLCCDSERNSRQQLHYHGVKKLGSNPPALALDQGGVDLIGVTTELCLNISALSSPNSLILQLTSSLIPGIPILALVDSSSTHCFLDTTYTSVHKLHTTAILPQSCSGFLMESQILLLP